MGQVNPFPQAFVSFVGWQILLRPFVAKEGLMDLLYTK
jgi:hypothetical protein